MPADPLRTPWALERWPSLVSAFLVNCCIRQAAFTSCCEGEGGERPLALHASSPKEREDTKTTQNRKRERERESKTEDTKQTKRELIRYEQNQQNKRRRLATSGDHTFPPARWRRTAVVFWSLGMTLVAAQLLKTPGQPHQLHGQPLVES